MTLLLTMMVVMGMTAMTMMIVMQILLIAKCNSATLSTHAAVVVVL